MDHADSYSVSLYQRPGTDKSGVVEQIERIAQELVGEWFTPDVPECIRRDLQFHDALCLESQGEVLAFAMFTSLDGAIHITLLGVRPEVRGRGLGSILMSHLCEHADRIGFDRIELWTVPPREKQCYGATVGFYQKHGFVIDKEVADLWDFGSALKLHKTLT